MSVYTEEQIKRVLAGAGQTIQNEVDSDYIIFCPFHPNNRTPAGEVDKRSGKFFCFSCHHIADLVELIMHTTGRTYFESVRFIKTKEQASLLTADVERQLYVKPDYTLFDKALIATLNESALSSSRAMAYYRGRSITEDSVKTFQLGYSQKQDMVTIPVHAPDGMPVGFVGRSVEGKDFKNTPGLPKGKVLFNLHRVKASSKVFVVESSFDAIRLSQAGLPAVATLGSNVSNTQIELLHKYFNNVVILPDNDEAGNNMTDRVTKKLGSRVSVVKLDSKYKDIGDMSDEEIKTLDESFDKSIVSMLQ
jgi:DNA primase